MRIFQQRPYYQYGTGTQNFKLKLVHIYVQILMFKIIFQLRGLVWQKKIGLHI